MDGKRDVVPTDHVHRLLFELFVDLEKVNDLLFRVLLKVVERLAEREAGIVGGDAENLLVRALLIPHFQDTDGTCFDDAAGDCWVGHQNEDIKRVAIEVVGLRNVAVIKRIKQRRIEHSIKFENARFLANLILVRAPFRDFDHGVKHVRGVFSNRYVEDGHRSDRVPVWRVFLPVASRSLNLAPSKIRLFLAYTAIMCPMGRKILLFVVALATFAVVGCGSGGGDAATIEKDAVGKYKMDVDTSGMKEDEKKMMDAMKGMFSSMKVELKADKTATMSAMGQNETGKWSVEGGKVIITPDKKDSKKMTLSPKGDGKTLVADMEGEEAEKMKGAKLLLVKE